MDRTPISPNAGLITDLIYEAIAEHMNEEIYDAVLFIIADYINNGHVKKEEMISKLNKLIE
jgi:hypothetical protein